MGSKGDANGGAENVHIVKAWFDSTVPSHKMEEPIAL
jgi:hypothetical protein